MITEVRPQVCQKTNICWPSLSHSTDLAMAKVELSQEQVEELRQAFDMFDRDKGGSISTRELGYTMRAMGMNPTEAEILDLLCEVRLAGPQNGLISSLV